MYEPHAFLVYGIALEKGFTILTDGYLWQEIYYKNKKGFDSMNIDRALQLAKTDGVDILTFSPLEYAKPNRHVDNREQSVLYVLESAIETHRYVKAVELNTKSEWHDRLKEFCRILNVPFSEPRWLLGASV